MTHPTPLYFDHPNQAVRFVEWQGLLRLHFNGKNTAMYEAFSDFEGRYLYWSDEYVKSKESPSNKWMPDLLRATGKDKEISTLEAFYKQMGLHLKPKLRGKVLKEAKKGASQRNYQRDVLGEGYIDNDALVSKAKMEALRLAIEWASPEDIELAAKEIEATFAKDTPLNDAQRKVLRTELLKKRISKHQASGKVDASVLATKDKSLWFTWGLLKQTYLPDEPFVMSQDMLCSFAAVSKSAAKDQLKELVKLGALAQIQKGKVGSNTRTAGIYKRLV